MTATTKAIRSEPHATVGSLIQSDAGLVAERWARRVAEEQPQARRAHHAALLDHLPLLLRELGASLAESGDAGPGKHCRPARRHGEQRWGEGWSLPEVVQDYQILRFVLVEYLEETLGRPLRSREVMAVSLALDESIAASVESFARASAERDRKAAEDLREADRRKDEALAVIAHELRNPLVPIRNAAALLALNPADPAAAARAGGLVERQVRHMTRLVDDLLDASRFSSGNVALDRRRLDLAALARQAGEDRRAAAAEAGLALSLDLPQGPLWVDGDPVRLTQVIGNLLQNALKFTDRGGAVTLRVGREGGRAVVAVRDTGVGIAPESLPRVFEAFVQLDRTRARSQGGLGLGLALVKGLAELHGGEVTAASEGAGRGAEFTVRLPLAEESPAAPQTVARPLRVLVIGDGSDAPEGLGVLLQQYGFVVAAAPSGAEGLRQAREQPPDVILCDLSVAGASAEEVARALRGDPATANIPLVALCGSESESDRRRYREAGFDGLLTMPVDPAALQALLAPPSARRPGSAP
jgi:signal transduction histidine kinase